MKSGAAFFIPLMTSAIALGCNASTDVETGSMSNISVSSVAPSPFCATNSTKASTATTRDARDARDARGQYWSAVEVQTGIRGALKSESFGCTPHSAYLAAYAAMTKARDAARCAPGSAMNPTTQLDTRLNDALADMMTRNYLQIALGCRQQSDPVPGQFAGQVSEGADIRGAFCSMHERAQANHWTALQVAMASTAYYLSTHVATALSALPHVDDLWVGTDANTLDARISKVRAYAPTYRAFNQFLGQNIVTVADSLTESGLTPTTCSFNVFKFGCSITQSLSTPKLLFGSRRDVAFDTALQMAKLIPPGTHPWTVKDTEGRTHMRANILTAPAFPKSEALAQQLKNIVSEGDTFAAALANPLMSLFGGHTVASLQDPNARASCEAQMSAF